MRNESSKHKDRKYVEHIMELYFVSPSELASWRGVSVEQMEKDLEDADTDPDWADMLADMAYNYSNDRTNMFGRWWP